MLKLVPVLLLALLGLAAPASAQLPIPGLNPDPVIATAGDIACDPRDERFNEGLGTDRFCRQMYTSDLLLGRDLEVVLPLGDTQYEDAEAWKWDESYDPSWGRFKDISRPVIGNHEYFADAGDGYFDYFNGPGVQDGPAGDRDKGYYSYDAGTWHMVALNSVCSRVGGCHPGSPQERWLRADLAQHPNRCTLVYWHHPLRTSGAKGWPSVEPLWRAAHDAGAEVVLAGHIHNYERLARLDASGRADPAYGVRSFVVGTGGKSVNNTTDRLPSTEAFNGTDHGVLFMTLRAGSYEWRYVPEKPGGYTDSGSDSCHGAPPPKAPAPVIGPASQVRGTTARLNGVVDTDGQPTTYRFEYGPTTAFGSSTGDVTIPGAGNPTPVTARLSGLERGSTYFFRLVASSLAGTTVTQDGSFVADRRSPYADAVESTDGLAGFWRLNEPAGSDVAFDALGRAPGDYRGTFELRRTGSLIGDGDRAAAFDGDSGYVRIPGPSLGATGTLEGWFKWDDGEVLMRDDSAQGGWLLAQALNGRFAYRVASTSIRTARSASTVRDGAWRHVALSKEAGTARLYIDGRLVHSAEGVGDDPSTMPWYVMRNGPFDEHAGGRGDDIAIYTRALSAGEIRAHYRAGVAERPTSTGISGPRVATNDPTPTFRLRSNARRASFRCSLATPRSANPGFSACPSARSFGALADGTYKFRAYAISGTEHPDPVPAVRTFTVDTVVPTVTAGVVPVDVRDLLRKGLLVGITCSEGCDIAVRATLRGSTARRYKLTRGAPYVLARATSSATAASPAQVGMRVAPAVARRLRRATFLPITITVTAADAATNARTVRVPLEVRR